MGLFSKLRVRFSSFMSQPSAKPTVLPLNTLLFGGIDSDWDPNDYIRLTASQSALQGRNLSEESVVTALHLYKNEKVPQHEFLVAEVAHREICDTGLGRVLTTPEYCRSVEIRKRGEHGAPSSGAPCLPGTTSNPSASLSRITISSVDMPGYDRLFFYPLGCAPSASNTPLATMTFLDHDHAPFSFERLVSIMDVIVTDKSRSLEVAAVDQASIGVAPDSVIPYNMFSTNCFWLTSLIWLTVKDTVEVLPAVSPAGDDTVQRRTGRVKIGHKLVLKARPSIRLIEHGQSILIEQWHEFSPKLILLCQHTWNATYKKYAGEDEEFSKVRLYDLFRSLQLSD